MRILFVISLLLVSTTFFAQAHAKARVEVINAFKYEKEIFNAATSAGISGGTPVNEQGLKLSKNNKLIGEIIAGKGFNDNDEKVCFVSWLKDKGKDIKLIPTVGYGKWEAEACLNTEIISLLPWRDMDIIAIIYKVASPNTIAYETIIFKVNENEFSIDQNITDEFGAEGVKTIEELKLLMDKKEHN
jgi:hypothetical protein